MEKMIKLNFRNIESLEVKSGTTMLEASEMLNSYFNYPILVGSLNNNLTDLSEKIVKDSKIDFYDLSNYVGNSAYGRSVQFMLILAAHRLFGDSATVSIENSIDKGVYCRISGTPVSKEVIAEVQSEMKKICFEDLKFTKVNVFRTEAIKYFEKKGAFDKVNVLKYISNTYINLHKLNGIYDYFYGDLAYSTKDINDFRLTYISGDSFVLSYPNVYTPFMTLEYVHHEMIANSFKDYTNWGKKLGIQTAADLNTKISTGKYDEIIMLSEVHYNDQLSRAADMVYEERNNIKIVLMAGPSSSGKTTTSKKFELYLKARGLNTVQISIDDYFVSREETPFDKNGNLDFESIKAIDVNLFNQHLTSLFDGEEVLMPEYNFALGKREYKNKTLKLDNNSIILVEGLHALNEDLTMSLPRNEKFKIYISPLTQLNIDNHNRIHTSDTRKLRRIVRDNKYRNYNAADTLTMWKSIREGEERWIFPYQDDANFIINSALIYELGVLKVYAEPLLFSVSQDSEAYPEALRLINFLRNFLPIPSDNVPKDSILREFIGGSSFKY